MRPLSAEEAALWARVAATIRPLSRDRPDPEPYAVAARLTPAAAPRPAQRPRAAAPPTPPPPPPRPGTTLDGSWDKKLQNGSINVDRVLDLHGHSLDRAWSAIDSGIDAALSRGDRVVLLITGHAPSGAPPVERGKIRAAVHDWLAVSRHASRIAAVRAAHPRHGGGGSLYLILRRR